MFALPPLPLPFFAGLLLRRTVSGRVEAFQPDVPSGWSPSSKRQPSRVSILPGETEIVPSHFVGALSVRPKRIRIPMSEAKTGHAIVTPSNRIKGRNMGDAKDANNAGEVTKV